jgi:hypothetical protein
MTWVEISPEPREADHILASHSLNRRTGGPGCPGGDEREGHRYWRHATSRWYSWIMPPSRSRLRTAPLLTELDDVGGEGRASRSPRCGRSAL